VVTRSVAAEAIANVLATPWRFTAVVLALAASLCWPAARQAGVVADAQRAKIARAADGAFVAVVSGQAGAAIDGRSCDALAGVAGIRAAGALTQLPAPAVASTAPDGGYPAWRISPGTVRVLGVTRSGAGVLVGAAAAGELGLADGTRIGLRAPVVQPSAGVAVVPARGARTALLDRAVMLVSPAADVQGSCLVEAAGTPVNAAATFLGALLGGQRVDVRPLAGEPDLPPEPRRTYRERADRVAGLVAPASALVLWLVLGRSRRGELALLRILAMPRSIVATQLVAELAICALVALVPVVACVAIAAQGDRVAALAALAGAARGLAVVAALAVPAAVGLGLRRGSELRALRGAE
jgi:hypothetical protein